MAWSKGSKKYVSVQRNRCAKELQQEEDIYTSEELENGRWSTVKKKMHWKMKAKQTTWCFQKHEKANGGPMEAMEVLFKQLSELRLYVPESSTSPKKS